LPCGLASLGSPRHRQVLKRHRRQPRGHAPATRRLGHPQADGLTDARCRGRAAMPSLGGRWSARGTSRVGGTAGLCVLPVRSAQPQTRARRRRLSTLWPHSTLTPPTKAAASKEQRRWGKQRGAS
jgi:hypothetical protein